MTKIEIIDGPDRGAVYHILCLHEDTGTLKIGRHELADVFLIDERISRSQSAILGCEDGAFVMSDSGGGNILINGKKVVGKKKLSDGDTIQIGRDILVFHEKTTKDEFSQKKTIAQLKTTEVDISNLREHAVFHPKIIGKSKPMQELFKQIEATVRAIGTGRFKNILVQGETGTGKELVAEAIHDMSNRKSKPFVRLNCTALPRELVESELFGYEAGTFTSATRRRIGILQQADGGMILLDEIGEMPIDIQPKLLRFLETGEIPRIGKMHQPEIADVVVIAATNRNLEEQIKDGKFRQDLFYRLQQFVIEVPPLRRRAGDIELLANHFLQPAISFGKIKAFIPAALRAMMCYNWPGNVRELKSAVERAAVIAETEGEEYVYFEHLFKSGAALSELPFPALNEVRNNVEKEAITKALQIERGNQTQAAKRLNMSARHLRRLIKKYDLNLKDFK